MRLWSLHPQYLDSKGLVALWREGLLARAVLKQQTIGYNSHPQLDRFKAHPNPVNAIEYYLRCVYQEASRRGFNFNSGKLTPKQRCAKITITDGQLAYELDHLKNKLKQRDPALYQKIVDLAKPEPHPLFKVIAGGIEPWERLNVPK